MKLSSSAQHQPVETPISQAFPPSNLLSSAGYSPSRISIVTADNKYKSMKIIVVDTDAENIAAGLQKIYPAIEILGQYTDGLQGIAAIFETIPDVAIINMDLAAVAGLARLGQHEQALVEIIFLSEWATFAYEAFRFGATDFLLKPFREAELRQSFERAAKKVEDKGKLKSIKPGK